MTRVALLALADRCEQATGMDRGLNLDIANAFYGDGPAPLGASYDSTSTAGRRARAVAELRARAAR